jgi:hypothetical protein
MSWLHSGGSRLGAVALSLNRAAAAADAGQATQEGLRGGNIGVRERGEDEVQAREDKMNMRDIPKCVRGSR